MQDLEQAIRERAYHLWIEGGCQHGHADAHWFEAQRELVAPPCEIAAGVSERPSVGKSRSGRKPVAKKKQRALA
ncbi:DUF2934 domain-containing protein [Bradyrhizobium sp. NP1]|uniref:DUF2934 domain-containing protein n=1 Tax=Bradyrhizobium sp. NP1 TaxID=3049772 RepID=UPI0025A5D079|nr:DUF2934 domain-containing protein [Bradyrhizobium sp. NP1]WJR75070.1 DUF2934 domain-containing protein [Bradyrhizobium sp. NP1]